MPRFTMLLTLATVPVMALGQCSKAGENCWDTKCCAAPGQGCYAKKKGYATCYEVGTCKKGMHLTDPPKDQYWECNRLTKCAWGDKSGENCMIKGCCEEPYKSCFMKVDGYGQCLYKCPMGWNCTKVTWKNPQLAFPCNGKYEQCGGQDFKKNPCCKKGLVCTGKHPKYYMQCRPEGEESEGEGDGDGDLDDDLGLSALPADLSRQPVPLARFLGLCALGAALVAVAGASALAVQRQVRRREAGREALCADTRAEDDSLELSSLEG